MIVADCDGDNRGWIVSSIDVAFSNIVRNFRCTSKL
jgi:hypothetical protein